MMLAFIDHSGFAAFVSAQNAVLATRKRIETVKEKTRINTSG
jgi:hypothetical protein